MKARTTKQAAANEVDLDLARLVGRAEWYGKETKDARWNHVVKSLRAARSHARMMMHLDDVAETPN